MFVFTQSDTSHLCTIAALTSQLEERNACVARSTDEIRRLEEQVNVLKIEIQNEKLEVNRVTKELEQQVEEIKVMRIESEKTIDGLKSNLESAHKRIQTVRK